MIKVQKTVKGLLAVKMVKVLLVDVVAANEADRKADLVNVEVLHLQIKAAILRTQLETCSNKILRKLVGWKAEKFETDSASKNLQLDFILHKTSNENKSIFLT